MAKLKQKSQITEKTKKILEERKTGKSIHALADMFGVSSSWVYQVLKKYGDTLPKQLAE